MEKEEREAEIGDGALYGTNTARHSTAWCGINPFW